MDDGWGGGEQVRYDTKAAKGCGPLPFNFIASARAQADSASRGAESGSRRMVVEVVGSPLSFQFRAILSKRREAVVGDHTLAMEES